MKPKELLFTHRYAEAVKVWRQEMLDQPDKNFYGALGQTYLALREFDEALKCFRRDNEIESSRTKGCFPSLNEVGTALWWMGRDREAVLEWHRAVAGILDRSVKYADAAGGGTQGLLLWYGAVTLKDEAE